MPRLHRFHRANRDIDMHLSTSGLFADFVTDRIDIAIRYGAGGYEGVVSEFLADEEVSPVCSPQLLQGEHPLRTPDDLRHHRLIHDNFRIDWATWLQHIGLDDIDPNSGVKFDAAAYAVEAAVQGEGVLLGRSALVSADLAAWRLVRPFGLALKSRWNTTSSIRAARCGRGRSRHSGIGCSMKWRPIGGARRSAKGTSVKNPDLRGLPAARCPAPAGTGSAAG